MSAIQAPEQIPQADPFAQGLDRAVALRLVEGTHTRADRAQYYRTPWWASVKARTLQLMGRSCALCGCSLALQVHHKPQAYGRLFREHPTRDLTVLCRNCHRRHHRR